MLDLYVGYNHHTLDVSSHNLTTTISYIKQAEEVKQAH
jgi:hypothetical protein